MTAPVPSGIWSKQAAVASNSTNAVSFALMGLSPSVGDLLVIVQVGLTTGAAVPIAPTSGPTGSESSTGWTDGPGTSGTDVYQNDGTAGHGRVQVWSKIATSSDTQSTSEITVSMGGFQGSNRWHVFVIPGYWAADRWKDHGSSNANGTSSLTVSGSSRESITIAIAAFVAAQSSLTMTYDGATSGVKFQRPPYCDESASTTTTGDGAGHTGTNHYGTNTGLFQSDYQEYDLGSPATSVAWVGANVANTSHALAFVHYREAVSPTFLDASPAFFGPDVIGTQQVAANFLSAAASFFAPAVDIAHETITANFLDASPTFFPPKLGMVWTDEVPMTPPSATELVSSAHLSAEENYPTGDSELIWEVRHNGTPVATSSTLVPVYNVDTQYTLSVSPPNGATSGWSIWWQITTYSQSDVIVSGPELVTADAVDANFLSAGPTFFSPGVSISAAFLDASPTFFPPSIPGAITSNLLDASPTLYTPGVTAGTATVTTPFLDLAPTIFAPSISTGVAQVVAVFDVTYRERALGTYRESPPPTFRERATATYRETQ